MTINRVILAEYFVAEDATLIFIAREDFSEPVVEEVALPRKRVRESVIDYLNVLQKGAGEVQVADAWQRQFRLLVEPVIRYAGEGDLIWFVPHDVLHYLPLHALPVEGRFLLDRNPVCYTPSASVMRFCQAKRKGRREQALVVGDSRGDLLYAREEARSIARLFSTTAYLESQATKALVTQQLAQQGKALDVLHISCHGYFDQEQALKSGIVLASAQESSEDGYNLTAEEIFNLSMNVDLVTLSACETGMNERKQGDELIGLTRALIYAGTPSVVVSLWAVDDLSTGLLMERFYQELRRAEEHENGRFYPITKAEALRTAQLYIKSLSAGEVVAYCDQHLAEPGQDDDAERRLTYLWGKAAAQLKAGDQASARQTCQEMVRLSEHLTTDRTRKAAEWASEMVMMLDFTLSEASGRPAVAYDSKPFESFYYWAPFILIGDWK